MGKIVVVNLKMNLAYEETQQYVEYIKNKISLPNDLIICPTSLYMYMFKGHEYRLGSQNVYSVNKGPFTGEMSPTQLKTFGIKYSLVGHSERRHNFHEDDKLIGEKIIACLNQNIKPILCIGETMEEKQLKKTGTILKRQLSILRTINADALMDVIIAYEPVWAIGSGRTPQVKEIEEAAMFIKDIINEQSNINIKVLYGGSVNRDNIKAIIKIKGIDGVLIGSAAADPKHLIDMLDLIN